MTFPLLVGLDGVDKMSKSKGNYIGVTEPPKDMFGKAMSIPDTLMRNYFTVLELASPQRIDELVDPNRTHPREAKAQLGKAIVARYHGAAAAEEAAAEFDRVFSSGQAPAEMPEVRVPSASMNAVDLIIAAGFAKSRSDARRLISQGAVSLDDLKVDDFAATLALATGQVLRVGKRRFGRIVVS